ncbi:hypothetical protein [Planktothricoides raciborskii]|uniref:Uncharacterized protein n=1 Tax=Planktothricoides raciborskii FACHB-1370 TaxID=2949576 RepID=A0ABR8EHX4_9CYAN|nr:hypothetical protein [Planktothricoides raciborskii]MBD2546216.1 hypothetical protein [Planktothricoides raciborskii FACHB-1370]MBD2584489.1 hypothetical protein [Planktothricoides raciborskii FACHB-1261]
MYSTVGANGHSPLHIHHIRPYISTTETRFLSYSWGVRNRVSFCNSTVNDNIHHRNPVSF